jgi:hypothetical protein
VRPRITLSWLPLTMLLVFAIASRTICTPLASARSDASPEELRALALRFFGKPRPLVESQLGLAFEGLGTKHQRWQCYNKDALDLHILYDSSGKAKSVLICQQRPEKTLLASWPPLKAEREKKIIQLAKR